MKTLCHLELSGYKSIKNVKLVFYAGINVLIGQNGSGKSNLLNFIKLLEDDVLSLESDYKIKVEWLHNEDEYVKELERTHSKVDFSVFDSLDLSKIKLNSKKKYSGSILKNGKSLFHSSELSKEEYTFSLIVAGQQNKEFDPEIEIDLIGFYNREHLRFLSHPSDSELSNDAVSEVLNSEIPFAAVLFLTFMVLDLDSAISRDKVQERFALYASHLLSYVKVYSPVKNIRLKDIYKISVKNDLNSIENVQLEFLVNDSWYKWDELSDGTRRILTIIDGVYAADSIVLIEEPELGIHPHQLSLLIEFLTEMSEDKQIIISTHSPDVLDSVSMDSLDRINIVSINDKGTSVNKLTDEQKEKAKIYFDEAGTIGDYWKHSDLEI